MGRSRLDKSTKIFSGGKTPTVYLSSKLFIKYVTETHILLFRRLGLSYSFIDSVSWRIISINMMYHLDMSWWPLEQSHRTNIFTGVLTNIVFGKIPYRQTKLLNTSSMTLPKCFPFFLTLFNGIEVSLLTNVIIIVININHVVLLGIK